MCLFLLLHISELIWHPGTLSASPDVDFSAAWDTDVKLKKKKKSIQWGIQAFWYRQAMPFTMGNYISFLIAVILFMLEQDIYNHMYVSTESGPLYGCWDFLHVS